MNKLRIMKQAGLLFLFCLSVSGFADDELNVRELESSGHILKLSQVIEKANQANPGRILEVQLNQELGRYVYEIEMIDNKGVIWDLNFDAKSGELLRKEKE